MAPVPSPASAGSFEQEDDRLVRQLLDGPEVIDGHADLAKAYVLKVFAIRHRRGTAHPQGPRAGQLPG
jgi:hypothetical protein